MQQEILNAAWDCMMITVSPAAKLSISGILVVRSDTESCRVVIEHDDTQSAMVSASCLKVDTGLPSAGTSTSICLLNG